MLFPLAYVMESNYNLEGTKLVITQISKAFYFETSITYHNIERCLYQMYEMYNEKFIRNVTRSSLPMWSANASPLDANNDDPKLALLTMISYSKINTYASTSSSLNQSTSNEDGGGISIELTRYFTQYIFTFSKHLDEEV